LRDAFFVVRTLNGLAEVETMENHSVRPPTPAAAGGSTAHPGGARRATTNFAAGTGTFVVHFLNRSQDPTVRCAEVHRQRSERPIRLVREAAVAIAVVPGRRVTRGGRMRRCRA
jgi:hypothetical protein